MTRKPMRYWNQPANQLAVCHSSADVNSASGYIRVSRENKIIYLHRWLWEELVGPIPIGHSIDYVNGIRYDCRLSNMRCVDTATNQRNTSKRTDNTSDVTGVSLWTAGNAWRATVIQLNGKQKCKTFSIAKWGEDLAFAMACDARQDMIDELNQQGAGYTQRHGK